VHGGSVVDVSRSVDLAGGVLAELVEGDAALATDALTCPAVLVADCLPIAIGSPEGVRVAVHAGWRGLVAGVIEGAVAAARSAGATALVAGMGPGIGPCCYEFSEDDLERVEGVLGSGVRAKTKSGAPSLDLRVAARQILRSCDVEICFEEPSCTACCGGWFSARARGDSGRQALYLWRDDL
jgi:copper oxidase (laccase) domain-containing protein